MGAFILSTLTISAATFMSGNGSMAVTFSTDANGNIISSSYHSAGPCAGGIWLVQLTIASTSETGGGCDLLPCNDEISVLLNENLIINESLTMEEDQIMEMQTLLDGGNIPKVILNPEVLDSSIYDYLIAII